MVRFLAHAFAAFVHEFAERNLKSPETIILKDVDEGVRFVNILQKEHPELRTRDVVKRKVADYKVYDEVVFYGITIKWPVEFQIERPVYDEGGMDE